MWQVNEVSCDILWQLYCESRTSVSVSDFDSLLFKFTLYLDSLIGVFGLCGIWIVGINIFLN